MLPGLRLIRTARGLSQAALAHLAGPPFSKHYVSQLERGLQPSRVQHVGVLARVLGVSERALLSTMAIDWLPATNRPEAVSQ